MLDALRAALARGDSTSQWLLVDRACYVDLGKAPTSIYRAEQRGAYLELTPRQAAPMLAGRVAAGGSLVLSGVLARQPEEVAAAYAPFIKLGVWAEQEGWVALHGTLGQDTVPPSRSVTAS